MDRNEFARDTLLREMREICYALHRKPWVDGIEHQLWAVLVGDSDRIDGKPLAAPLLAHIDGLQTFSEQAGGWFTADRADAFVPLAEWRQLYASRRLQ